MLYKYRQFLSYETLKNLVIAMMTTFIWIINYCNLVIDFSYQHIQAISSQKKVIFRLNCFSLTPTVHASSLLIQQGYKCPSFKHVPLSSLWFWSWPVLCFRISKASLIRETSFLIVLHSQFNLEIFFLVCVHAVSVLQCYSRATATNSVLS